MPNPTSTAVVALGTLTSSGAFTNAQTITCGGKTYTTQTTLTDSDGNVAIGGSAAETLRNLMAAINLGAGAGTAYAASMTRNKQVYAASVTATTLVVKAKHPGTSGNLIVTTETQTNAAWGAGTLASGDGDPALLLEEFLTTGQVNADLIASLRKWFALSPP